VEPDVSPGAIELHRALYRRVLALTPPHHRARFGEDQIRLFGDLLVMGESPSRLWLRTLPDLVRVLVESKETMVNHAARVALGTLSLGPLALGFIVAWIAIDEFGDEPRLLPLVALGLLLQGGFTLLWLGGRLSRWQRLATDALIVGEVAAMVTGAVIAADAVASWIPSDPEYAPILIGVVMAAHGLVGLFALFTAQPQTLTI
jgi:hypothetical protein